MSKSDFSKANDRIRTNRYHVPTASFRLERAIEALSYWPKAKQKILTCEIYRLLLKNQILTLLSELDIVYSVFILAEQNSINKKIK